MTRKPQIHMKSPAQPPLQKQAVGFSLILSVLFHVAVIALLVVTPRVSGGHRLAPGPVSVRLVSLPGPSAGGSQSPAPAVKPLPEPITAKPQAIEKMPTVPLPEPEPTVKPVPIQKPAPVEVKESPKVVSLTPPTKPPKPKASLKKKTKDSSKIIKSAIDRIKKGVDQPKRKEPSVNAALQRLKKQVAETEARRLEPYRPQSAGGTGTEGGGGGGGGNRAITMEDIYRAEVAALIEKNWAFPKDLAGGGAGLEALLDFKVLPNGEITDIRFAAKSNNAYLDDSAYKAIVKSNPVIPHPRGISKSFVPVGMRFTTEGNR